MADNHSFMTYMCAQELSDSTFNLAVIGKISIFQKKLPQISEIHKNSNFLSIILIF